MVFNDILATMIGRIQAVKPNARQTDCRAFINDRIRRLIDRRIFWADLLARGVINIPNAYITGTVTATLNSQVLAGVGTAWPVSDVSNTIIPAGIQDYGYQEVVPASMVGIVTDSMLYVDAGGTPEVVAVIATTPGSFTAQFKQFHNPNCTVTQSSLAGLQIKFTGTGGNYPAYNVNAIVSATSALLDLPWGGVTLPNASYQILKMYYTIDPAFKDCLDVWDPVAGTPLDFRLSLEQVNWEDPQRTQTGDPIGFLPNAPTAGGTMAYEIWPNQTSARQLQLIYTKQWPELINPTDRPPPFISPSIIIDGATADALRVNNGAPPTYDDKLMNPRLADTYEAKWAQGCEYAINADESKALQAYTRFRYGFGVPGGANWRQTHDEDAYFGAV